MLPFRGARLLARLILFGCGADVAAAAHAADAADAPDQSILVTGTRDAPAAQTEESLDAERIRETVSAVNVEDSLRYLPSLLVRKRHVADTQAPLATRTSGVGASARSLIYVDGILVSALIGNNNSFASPRWGIVSPDEVERIDVLYGPFSAAFPGNSIGGVVEIGTRLPERFEASLTAQAQLQHFSQYGTDDPFDAKRLAAGVGSRSGPLAWRLGANHVRSRSHPLAYVTVARPSGTSAAGTPATGAFDDVNRINVPIFVIGAGGIETQDQTSLSARLALDLGDVTLGYRGALFLNNTDAAAQSYLRGPAGQPLFAGTVNIEGRTVNIPTSAFSNNVYRLDERHFMHALTLDARAARLEWRAIATVYDYDRDRQRIPATALPAAQGGGPGSIVRLDGTGWRTLDLSGTTRPDAAHRLSFGGHYDRFDLSNRRFATADWRSGAPGILLQAAEGLTRTFALWAEDRLALLPALELTVGARYEWWRASRGLNFSAMPPLSVDQPEQRREGFSPKAELGWTPADHWHVSLAAGQAYRFPTVSELYQAISTGPTISVPNPNLRPERARSEELAVTRSFAAGRLRLSLFNERIRDALISQSAPLVPGSTALLNFVQNIPEVRTRGIELAGEARDFPLRDLDIAGSVTLADPEILADPVFPTAEGKNLPQVPRRRATLVLTWRPTTAATFTLAGRYSSRSFGTIDNSDTVSHTWQGFDGYFVVDARATWRLSGQLEAAVGIENLTNDRYFLFHPFPQRSVTAEIRYRWN